MPSYHIALSIGETSQLIEINQFNCLIIASKQANMALFSQLLAKILTI